MATPKVYAAVATPTRISKIVNTFSPEPNGRASPNPTVLTVMTVWNTASSRLMPKPRYPIVPAIRTKSSPVSPTSNRRRPSSQDGPSRRAGCDVGMIRIVPGCRRQEPVQLPAAARRQGRANYPDTDRPPRCAMASMPGLGGGRAYCIAPMTQPPAPAITMPAMTFLAAGVPGSGEWKAQMPMLALTSKLS
jgi:hypothetical protein